MSAEAAAVEAQVATAGQRPCFFAASCPPQPGSKSHCKHVGADSLEMETRGKGRAWVRCHCPALDDPSLSCPCLVVIPQHHVRAGCGWRWSAGSPGVGFPGCVLEAGVGPGGSSMGVPCLGWGTKLLPVPREVPAGCGRRHRLCWEHWCILQPAMGSAIYGKRQLLGHTSGVVSVLLLPAWFLGQHLL